MPLSIRFPRLVLPALAFAIAGCSGNGCGGCMAPTPGGFPSAERVPNAVQVRVTPTAFDTIEADPASLVDSLLGTSGGAFPVPASCGGNPEVCCDGNGNPIDPCGPVDIDLVEQNGDAPRLEINPSGANHLQVIARARVKTVNKIKAKGTFIGITASCDISIDTTASGGSSMTLALDLDLGVNPTTNTTEIQNVVADVSGIDSGDLSLDGGFACGLADFLGPLKDFVIGQVTDSLASTLEDTLSNATCKACPSGDVSDCGEFADACADNVCMRGDSCLQEIGLAGRLLGSAFSSFSSGQQGAVDLYEVAGGYSETSGGGLSLGLLGGMLPAGAERDRCGPPGTKPDMTSVARSSFFSGNTRPDTGNPFDVGIGIHKQNLDMFSYSAYDSGLLCLNIGPQAVDLLNSDTFSVLMPSLLDIAHDQVAPVLLGLRPQSQPVFTLGAGTTTPNGDIDDPLMTVDLPGLEIDFFALIDHQWIRVMTMSSDVSLPINLEVDPSGSLTPVLGDVGEAFQNIAVKNSDALAETPAELADRFPVLLDLAVPLLAKSLSIDLPGLGALRLQVQPDGITSIENNSILAIFADLSTEPPPMARVETSARIVSLSMPEAAAFAAPERYRGQQPSATLELGGQAPGGEDLEWSYRVDDGLWSPYSRNPRRVVSRRTLWLQGRHRIQVRARAVGRPRTADLSPVTLELPIDTAGPHLSFRYGFADKLWVSASDYVSDGPVDLEYQLPGGDWRSAGEAAQGGPVAIDLDGAAPNDVMIRASDSRGNLVEGNPVLGFHGSGDDGAGCNCDSSGSAGGGLFLALLCLLGLCRRGSRRRRLGEAAAALVALVLIGLAPACSCGDSPCVGGECQPGQVDPGPTGRWLSIAGDDNRLVMAAYEQKLGDLVVIDVADDGSFETRVADGVPDAKPVYDPGTYRGGVRDPGPNVGAWTSVALVDGKAEVSYMDLDSGQLKLARENGKRYDAHAIDGGDGEQAGFFTSLAIRDGVPSIAYSVIGVAGDDGQRLGQLRFARAKNDKPSSPGDWDIQVIDEVPISCAGLCGDDFACIAPGGAERCALDTGDCPDACADGSMCFDGACEAIIDPPASYDVPLGTGLYANQVTLGDGRAAIIYYNRSAGDLMAAVEDGDSFSLVPLDAAAGTDTGAAATAVVDDAGLVHVAYQDAIGDRLLYLTFDGESASAPDVVDDGVRQGEFRTHPVGAGAAIAVSGGEVVIGYQDGLTADLVVARGSAGSWTREAVRSDSTVEGFYNGIAAGGGARWIATYSYDRAKQQGLPGEIFLSPLP